ncbi:FitA-like ribbon-helix-helix domain-containing protein [Sorangium sp. So ce1153]|uniref:FitA-like ribbon-helix-helix domain-containing protein n=1 Tax=Sorangium sp. So ce1153 TaxID=3133333 RepID=UPI003F639C7F
MAELILKNIDPSLVQKLEQQAKRSGVTVEAEVVRVLEAEYVRRTTPADWPVVTADPYDPDAELDADIDAPEPGAGTERPGSSPPPDPSSEPLDARAKALAERQAALAEAYPDEYVVLVDERLIAHTRDKDEAYAHYDAAFEQGVGEPIVIPPGALRRVAPPVLRGRLLFVLDGEEETFSMLLPEDEDNQQRRRRILSELSEPPA